VIDWIPKPGEMIYIGVPSVSLSRHEFLAVTSDNKFIYWEHDKKNVRLVNPEYCYASEVNKETQWK